MAEILTYEDFGGPVASAEPVENSEETQKQMGRRLNKEQEKKIGGMAVLLTEGFADKRDERLDELGGVDLGLAA